MVTAKTLVVGQICPCCFTNIEAGQRAELLYVDGRDQWLHPACRIEMQNMANQYGVYGCTWDADECGYNERGLFTGTWKECEAYYHNNAKRFAKYDTTRLIGTMAGDAWELHGDEWVEVTSENI